MFTFVIPAFNEESTVATIVAQALAAAQPGDRVLVVDSASTDSTADKATEAGAQVLRGPRGKGATMEAALGQVRTEWVCFLDADLVSSTNNVPEMLREAAVSGVGDHVLGDYEYDYPGTVLSATFTIYAPLVAELFPEVGFHGANTLTGYRALRMSHVPRPLPSDFGVETFLNISTVLAHGKTSVCHLGVIESRFRYNGGSMAREIGGTIFDLAIAHGRLEPDDRPAWEQWLETGVEAIAPNQADSGRSATLARLFAAVRRPMPARKPVG